MHKILKSTFGYDDFRPLQKEVISNVLEQGDSFVLMPTGGGKSLCYQIPALKFTGLTIVISPLISLMKDQVDALKENGVSAAYWNSSLSSGEVQTLQENLKQQKIKLLYLAPERLALEFFQKFLQTLNICLIAVDEAHCISEWGHDFRPDYKVLSRLKNWFPKIPLIALTATATPQVQKDILQQLQIPEAQVFQSSFERKNLEIQVIQKRNAFLKLVQILESYKKESVIIYCFSRKETEELSEDLKRQGFSTLNYHAGLDSEIRKKNQEDFIKDKVNIVCATIAFGMGIDKPDVRLVVHYTYPKSLENYYQEIGRAGRDGLLSKCVLFFTHADTRKHEFFLEQKEDLEEKKREKAKLREVIHYAETQSCRTRILLNYFGEVCKKNCEHCDNCLNKGDVFDATEISQKIFSAILKTGSKFGMTQIIQVLKGSQDQSILKNQHNELSVYGIVQDFSRDELKQLIQSLIKQEFLQKSTGEYPILTLTEKGIRVLKERVNIKLPHPKVEGLDNRKYWKESLTFHEGVFENLRQLRTELARNRGVAPFMIVSDKSLQELAFYLPQSLEDIEKIHGFGKVKIESFGQSFLCVLCEAVKTYQLSPQLFPKKILNGSLRSGKRTGSNANQTKEMLKGKVSLKQMAHQSGFTEGTIINHIEKLLDEGEDIDIAYLKPNQEIFKSITEAFKKSDDGRLKPVFDALNEKYSYDEIRLVKLFLK